MRTREKVLKETSPTQRREKDIKNNEGDSGKNT